jgi:hypothetical protein
MHIWRVAQLGLLLFLAPLVMQGCLGLIWVGAVGIDWTRTSDIEFQPFENSWVAAPQVRQSLGSPGGITVTPFVGDPVMAERWTSAFRRVVSHPVVLEGVRPVSAGSHVDCILVGNVISQKPYTGFAGLKQISVQRLYLHLMTHSGTLLWKTELPYTMVKGPKNLDEEMVTKAFLTHVRAHANQIGLDGLNATTEAALPEPSISGSGVKGPLASREWFTYSY